ncbi:MAG: transcriptional regulator, LuxR family, partial [Ilumatobacteraceae bacterium]|nr:transcriptional regulator, LuxR family [Ilumatobacteraceae bacterium]
MLDALRVSVPFDAYAWLLTDPVTSVGCDPLAETPSLADLPALIRSKYLTVTNRWTTLPSNTAVTLMTSTEGALDRSLMWRELLSKYGVDDVASIAFRDRHGCWGFLDLWRMGGRFTADDCAALDAMADVVTPALRRCAAAAFDLVPSDLFGTIEPAVLLLSYDIQMLAQTPQTYA